jgi:hypothetical protein
VTFDGDGFDPRLRAKVAEQLGADLGGHRLALCDAASAPSSPPPLADVALSLSVSSVLSLEVVDAVTDKRMGRRVPLATVPRDALALSIALAAEELLHASWIEAALAPLPEAPLPAGREAVPAEVREVNRETIAALPEPSREAWRGWAQATLLAAGERSAGGQTDLGADLRFTMGDRVSGAGQVGVRAAPDVQSAHGVVRGRELLVGLGLGYLLVPRASPWGAAVDLRADLVDVQFSAIASAGAASQSGSELGVLLGAYLGGWRRLGGPWSLVAEAGLGAPVRAVTASDAGSTATGVSGLTVGAALGVAATLPP